MSLSETSAPPTTDVTWRIELYPTFGRLQMSSNRWRMMVRGRLYVPRADDLRRRIVTRLMSRVLTVPPHELGSEIFRERIHGFLVKPRRGEPVQIRLAEAPLTIHRVTERGGHFVGAFEIPEQRIPPLTENASGVNAPWVRYEATIAKSMTPGNSAEIANDIVPSFCGQSQLIGPCGMSVISDIDDTIKLTNVRQRRDMLANTFLRPFRSIEGMADVYRHWQDCGAVFHYVSASPWQLFQPLHAFAAEHGFPRGTYHLRCVKFRNSSMLQLMMKARRSKAKSILSIVKAFPFRRFVLIGDAGEKDPEIYGAIARRVKGRIAAILIRELPGAPLTAERSRRAFHEIPRELWHVFRNAEELGDYPFPADQWPS
ncbi:MAG: DUF2183 domain-containing protein [Planctomycetales bacterium]|nr:DUF2183 domain-containing protein [Planctomycetales bacterium]